MEARNSGRRRRLQERVQSCVCAQLASVEKKRPAAAGRNQGQAASSQAERCRTRVSLSERGTICT